MGHDGRGHGGDTPYVGLWGGWVRGTGLAGGAGGARGRVPEVGQAAAHEAQGVDHLKRRGHPGGAWATLGTISDTLCEPSVCPSHTTAASLPMFPQPMPVALYALHVPPCIYHYLVHPCAPHLDPLLWGWVHLTRAEVDVPGHRAIVLIIPGRGTPWGGTGAEDGGGMGGDGRRQGHARVEASSHSPCMLAMFR